MLYIICNVTETFGWQDVISLLLDVAAFGTDLLSIGLVIIGMSLFFRLKEKHEESVFGFYSSFLVYLKLILKALGTQESNVLLYNFVDDARKEEILNKKIPSCEELKQFKEITQETLQFLKTAEVQFSFSKEVYKNRQILVEKLIEWQNLGSIYKYGTSDTKKAENEFLSVNKLLSSMIDEIEEEQKRVAEKFWKKTEKKKRK